MNAGIAVDLFDCFRQGGLGAVIRQQDRQNADADLFTALENAAFIGQIFGPLTDAENGQAGIDPPRTELFRTRGQILGDRVGDRRAFQNFSH